MILSSQNVYAQNEQVDNINLSDKFYFIGNTLVYDSNLASNPKEQGIREGDDVYLELYILAGNVNALRVTSNGGLFDVAIKMGDIVSKYNLNTEASRACISACVYIFIAGKKRALLKHSRLGFHSGRIASQANRDEDLKTKIEDYDERLDYVNTIIRSSALNTVELIRYFSSKGVKLDFILKTIEVHPMDTWFPKEAELRKAGVVN